MYRFCLKYDVTSLSVSRSHFQMMDAQTVPGRRGTTGLIAATKLWAIRYIVWKRRSNVPRPERIQSMCVERARHRSVFAMDGCVP